MFHIFGKSGPTRTKRIPDYLSNIVRTSMLQPLSGKSWGRCGASFVEKKSKVTFLVLMTSYSNQSYWTYDYLRPFILHFLYVTWYDHREISGDERKGIQKLGNMMKRHLWARKPTGKNYFWSPEFYQKFLFRNTMERYFWRNIRSYRWGFLVPIWHWTIFSVLVQISQINVNSWKSTDHSMVLIEICF